MTIARRLIILVGIPLVALIGMGVFFRVQLDDIESHNRFVVQFP